MPYCVCIVLAIAVIALLCKNYLLRKSIREICTDFENCLSQDTNTQITISSGDKTARSLAIAINHQLSEMRKIKQWYSKGDHELKTAVANISHDLRTPLTAICGYLDLLEKQDLSEDVSRYVGHIRNRADALKHLTDELLMYSALSSMPELSYERINLCRILQEVLISYEGIFNKVQIKPEIVMPDKAVWRKLDPAAVSRIFENVLNNIVKYSDGDCDVCLNEEGTITFTNTAKYLSVIDVSKLFDHFYTVDSARRSTGLGLSIAKLLTERMNGEINAKFENDKLTIFISFQKAASL